MDSNNSFWKHENPSPRLAANVISRLFFCWLNPLFWYARKHDLEAKDLHNALPNDLSGPLGDKLEKLWKREVETSQKNTKKPSLLRAVIKTSGASFLKYGAHILLLSLVIKVLVPYTLGLFISHFDPCSTTTTFDAYMLATCVVCMLILQAIIGHHTNLSLMEIGMRLRIACSSLIYRKSTRLSSAAAGQAAGGLIINLLSNDVARFDAAFAFLHYVWTMPFQVAVITYLIWGHVGIAAFVGVSLITLLTLPVQVYCGKLVGILRKNIAMRTDRRILLMNEIITGIKVIKMYTWEKPFEKLVSFARKHEVRALIISSYLKGTNLASFVFIERASLFVTILVYVLQGNAVSADKVFTMAQYYNILQLTMAIFFQLAVGFMAEAFVSIERIENFLLLEELDVSPKKIVPINNSTNVLIKNVNASWSDKMIANTLHNINIVVPQEKLYAIIGPIGAGKSSILKLILGELKSSTGQVQVIGNLSYASQEPWLFNGSVRNNILFGAPYDQAKYEKVTDACALLKDFEQFPHGDKSLVGERGSSLSGGQQARVNLARAVYRDADIYLFDDPLSAVDTHVGNSLFKDCIKEYLKGKTRVLVTHQIQYLNEVDAVVFVNNGQVEFVGSFENFKKNQKFLRHLPSNDETAKTTSEKVDPVSDNAQVSLIVAEENDEKEPEETEELMAKGNVAKSIYWRYFRAGGSYYMLLLLVLLFIIAQFSSSGCDYWLGYWTRQEEQKMRDFMKFANSSDCSKPIDVENSTFNERLNKNYQDDYLDRNTAMYVYTAFILCSIVWTTARNTLFFKICMNASTNLHNSMFACLLRAPMQFFDVNPSGRILNRFSKDIGAVDERLPLAMIDTLQIFSVLIGISFQVLMINWWCIFPMLIVGFLIVQLRNIYLSTAQDIKRLEGNAKSPVFSHTNSSLAGLTTIRACRAQNLVCKEFDVHQDHHTASYSLILTTSAAFGFWLDMVSISFIAFVTYSFIILDSSIFAEKQFAGNIGLAITQSLTVCGMLQHGVRQMAETITLMTSVERVIQFTELKQEEPFESEPGQKPSKEWPSEGKIEFKGLYLKYADESEPSLKNLNIVITTGMKVGIVGRTGAGKSSLVSALFRLAKIDGSLLIDNVDVTKIGLTNLRSKISIIPQEPMLFSATLRDNLDPFHEFDDASLWAALQDVELNKSFNALDHIIDRQGGNLSAGQRQLLCLARAIVKNNKILIMDEATANVDLNTDKLIQKTIRIKFKDCTVLTIAHRLNTVADSDRVMVMDNGVVVEFEHPHTLLQNVDGHFLQMVLKTGNGMAEYLKLVAKKAYNPDDGGVEPTYTEKDDKITIVSDKDEESTESLNDVENIEITKNSDNKEDTEK